MFVLLYSFNIFFLSVIRFPSILASFRSHQIFCLLSLLFILHCIRWFSVCEYVIIDFLLIYFMTFRHNKSQNLFKLHIKQRLNLMNSTFALNDRISRFRVYLTWSHSWEIKSMGYFMYLIVLSVFIGFFAVAEKSPEKKRTEINLFISVDEKWTAHQFCTNPNELMCLNCSSVTNS